MGLLDGIGRLANLINRRDNNPSNNTAPTHTADYVRYYPRAFAIGRQFIPGVTFIPHNKWAMNTTGFEEALYLPVQRFVSVAQTSRAVGDGIIQPYGRGTVPVSMPQVPRR